MIKATVSFDWLSLQKLKVNELEMKALNQKEFLKWDWKQVVIWILSPEQADSGIRCSVEADAV